MRFLDRVRTKFRRAGTPMRRLTLDEIAAEKKSIEEDMTGLSDGEMTIEQSMRIVDYMAQRYLHDDDTRTEAEWRAARSNIEQRIRMAMAGETVEPKPVDPKFLAWMDGVLKR